MQHAFWDYLLKLCDKDVGIISDFIFTPEKKLLYNRNGAMEVDGETVPQDFFDDWVKELNGGDEKYTKDVDCAYSKGKHRFRINFYQTHGQRKIVARLLPNKIIPIEKIGLPKAVQERLDKFITGGLVIVTGATGSGKNTTVASILNNLVVRVPGHIVTLEDPIEYLIGAEGGFDYRVSQREIGHDVPSFSDGLRSILRQTPKIIFIGEVRDKETAAKMLEAAQTGHLVITTMHTTTAAETVDRLLRFFTPEELPYISATAAEVLKLVLCQRLEMQVDQKRGRMALFEVLMPDAAIRAMISDNRVADIRSQMEIGRGQGQQTFAHAYKEAESTGRIQVVPNRFGK